MYTPRDPCSRIEVIHADFRELVQARCPRCQGWGEACLATRMDEAGGGGPPCEPPQDGHDLNESS